MLQSQICQQPHILYECFSRKYGKIFRLGGNFNGKIVVSDVDMIKQILKRNSSDFANRTGPCHLKLIPFNFSSISFMNNGKKSTLHLIHLIPSMKWCLTLLCPQLLEMQNILHHTVTIQNQLLSLLRIQQDHQNGDYLQIKRLPTP